MALAAPYSWAHHADAPASERQLRRGAAPVMMGAHSLVLALRTRQRFRLRPEHRLQRVHAQRTHPLQQMAARRRHPGDQRRERRGQRLARSISALRSSSVRCSLRHGGSLVPARWTGWSWQTRFSGLPGSRRYSSRKFNSDRDISRFGLSACYEPAHPVICVVSVQGGTGVRDSRPEPLGRASGRRLLVTGNWRMPEYTKNNRRPEPGGSIVPRSCRRRVSAFQGRLPMRA
jgi:hypothetical protein